MPSETPFSSSLAQPGFGSDLRAQPPEVALALQSPVALVRLTNVSTGQVIQCDDGLSCLSQESPTREAMIALDTMTNAASTAGLNVAYVDPLSYVGMSQSTAAFAIGLAERNAYRAPMDAATGFPLPTDILWNDYGCDPAIWPSKSMRARLSAPAITARLLAASRLLKAWFALIRRATRWIWEPVAACWQSPYTSCARFRYSQPTSIQLQRVSRAKMPS